MNELRGSLQDFGLVPLVRFVSEQGRSGSLTITHAGWVGEVIFDEGRVVAAAVGEERGDVALELIALALASGDFVFADGPAAAYERSIASSPAELEAGLEERMARATGCWGTPLLSSVPRVVGDADESNDHTLTFTRSELAVLRDVDGRHTLQEIVRRPHPVQALHALARLSEIGVIELQAPNSVAGKLALPERAQPAPVVRWSWLLVPGVAAVALLTTVFVLMLRLPPQAVVDKPVLDEISQAAVEAATPGAITPLPAPVVEQTPLPIEPTALPAAPTIRTVLAGPIKDQRGWPSHPDGTAWLDGNAYRLSARQLKRFVAVAAPVQATYSDVFVSAAFHKIGGPPGGGYGIIVRDEGPAARDGVDQSGRFYVAAVGDRGEIGVWRRENDHWIDILPWTASAAVYPGGTSNELAVHAIGPRLTVYVNGIETTTLLDTALSSGRVGAFVGGDYNEVVLDRFTIQLPPTGVRP